MEVPVYIGYKYAVNDDFALDIFGDDGFKRFDFGLGLKAGVEFSRKYQVAISYDFGLVDVQKDLGMKNRNLMISLGYMF